MGQIKKIGDQYYIEFYARGLMYSQPAGATEEDARIMLSKLEAKIAQGEALTIVREIDLAIFFEKFVDHSKDKFSTKSIERFQRLWQNLTFFLNKDYPQIQRLSQITPSVIESYKRALEVQVSPKVVNLSLLLLREVLEYGIKIGFLNDNPTLHVRFIKIPTTKIAATKRSEMAHDLLGRGVGLEKVCSILKLKDVAKIMYWSQFIPLQRKDVY